MLVYDCFAFRIKIASNGHWLQDPLLHIRIEGLMVLTALDF